MTRTILFSVPGLRPGDIDPKRTPTLHSWANSGSLAPLIPTFPCVTSPVQASMITGVPPSQHGIIANGFLYRERRPWEVEFWVGRNGLVEGEPVWQSMKRKNSNIRTAVWHLQNIKDATADFIVTPSPIHEADGSTKLWCYSKPESLYETMLSELGHFPLQHYWGPMANIESTRWILNGCAWLAKREAPELQWVYLPHLDYAAQKHGPNSPQAQQAVVDLDLEMAKFVAGWNSRTGVDPSKIHFIVAGEYALTDVRGVVFPNRTLREAGLLTVAVADGRELVDFGTSPAFAVVDHQLAHVYVRDRDAKLIHRIGELFASIDGIDEVAVGDGKRRLGIDHPRSGDVVLVSAIDHWFAYYWWLDDGRAPGFARTVDIHQKPGYDPVELFFDPKNRCIPLDAGLVRGSHGSPCVTAFQESVIISSKGSSKGGPKFKDLDVSSLVYESICSH